MRTEYNILKHELIGLEVEVVEAKNNNLVGLKGKIVDESKESLTLSTPKGERKVLKKGVGLKMLVNGKEIIVDGDMLVGRPEDRIKK